MKEITVCIVDDNKELRDSLKEVISDSEGFYCIGSLSNPDEAIAQIPALEPDVVLMDINLGTAESGIDCVRALKPLMPRTNFMICTIYADDEKVFDALSAGANGYILKKTEPEKLLAAIRELHEGGAPMSSEIAKKVVRYFQKNNHSPSIPEELRLLTLREKEILGWLAQGLMYKEIAAKLNISTETVRKHVYNVYEKLHVNNRVAAVNILYGR